MRLLVGLKRARAGKRYHLSGPAARDMLMHKPGSPHSIKGGLVHVGVANRARINLRVRRVEALLRGSESIS